MREFLNKGLNSFLEDEISILFGENSKIIVNNFTYITNNKKYHVDCNLLIGEYDEDINYNPFSIIKTLILYGLKIFGFSDNITLSVSITLI